MRLIHNVPFTPSENERESQSLGKGEEGGGPGGRGNPARSSQPVPLPLVRSGFFAADYRQLVFSNLVSGMRTIIDTMDQWEMCVAPDNRVRRFPSLPFELLPRCRPISLVNSFHVGPSQRNVAIVDAAPDLARGQSFPIEYMRPLIALWTDPEVQRCYERGNEAALPEK